MAEDSTRQANLKTPCCCWLELRLRWATKTTYCWSFLQAVVLVAMTFILENPRSQSVSLVDTGNVGMIAFNWLMSRGHVDGSST